jgi:hypothetical protein
MRLTNGASDRIAGDRLVTISLGLVFGYIGVLALMIVRHDWVLSADGRPDLTDFSAVWTAGRLALSGAALSAYDGAAQHAAEIATIGHGFAGFYGWPYPPSFFFPAAGLASMPYAWAFGAWAAAGLALYGLSVAAVARHWSAALVAFASPWALANLLVGQNGFLTAGLVALVLLTLERRPVLAGVLLGLLTYKPQFGLLFPLALAVRGQWRTFAWAAATTLGLLGLSSIVFGPETFIAFLRNLPQTNQDLVSNGGVGWGKLQSVYGLARGLGAPLAVGWAVQGLVTATAALATAIIWRSRAPFELRAACLALAAVIATPYVFAYDLPILAVPLAFLWRQRRFDRVEYALLAVVGLAMVPYLFGPVPSGLAASLAIGVAIGRRAAASGATAVHGGLAAA